MNGEYIINKPTLKAPVYCHVKLEVTDWLDKPYGLTIELLDEIETYNAKYINTIRVAIDYFNETLSFIKGHRYVTITLLDTRLVDTKNILVFMCVVKALCNAYNIENNIDIDEKNFTVSFPIK